MASIRINVMFSFIAAFLLAVNTAVQYSCKTYGREAVLKGTNEQWKSRRWAKCSHGKWETLDGNTANKSQSDVAAFAQQFAAKSCCDLNCRSTAVPSDQLQKAPFSSVVYIELYTANYVRYCSGSVVADRVVLTAVNCLFDSDQEPILGGVVKGWYKSPGNPTVTVNIKRWRYFLSCNDTDTIPDYGVIVLERNPKFPILPIASYLDPSSEQQLAIIGFPLIQGIPVEQMIVDTKKVSGWSDYGIFTAQLISGERGNGSPIIALGIGQIAVFSWYGLNSDATCLATDQYLGGPFVWGSPFNVTNLIRTVL